MLLITQQSSAGGQSEPGEIVSEVMGYGGGPVYTSENDGVSHPSQYWWCERYEY